VAELDGVELAPIRAGVVAAKAGIRVEARFLGRQFLATLPNLTPDQVAILVPQASDIQPVGRGGQKLVFRGTIAGTIYALKFANITAPPVDDLDDFALSDIAIRAKREVETMRECTSPFVVKLGPVGLSFGSAGGQQLVFFSEEYIAGSDLKTRLQTSGKFDLQEVAKLGRQVGLAIKALWEFGKIHRDVKPANIMRRDIGGDYVLLDAGLAFDIDGESISVGPVGTPAYFSPEQFEFTNRRTVLDFRSDMFSLGVTMYYLLTAMHPFWSQGDTTQSLYSKITRFNPQPPSSIVNGLPDTLDEVVMRLLGKSPHLRFRTCDHLVRALEGV
jgi:eukaryotic-like serine/threonine-protein kinase